MVFHYAVTVEPEDDGYWVIVPAVSVVNWAASVEQGMSLARVFVRLDVQERLASGEYIPPSDFPSPRPEAVTVSIPTEEWKAIEVWGDAYLKADINENLLCRFTPDDIDSLLKRLLTSDR